MHAVTRTLASHARRIARLRVAPTSWDPHLRVSVGAAVVALVIALLVPELTELAIFFTAMLVACGPTSAFLPAVSEPVLMLYGKLYPPVLIALIGMTAVVVVEFLNYSMFDSILNSNRLARIRGARLTRLVMQWFSLQPFASVSVAAFSPIPFWIARSCAVLSRYPKARYMCATASGRFFRFYVIATVGSALPVTTGHIVTAGAMLIALFAVGSIVKRRNRVRHGLTPA